MKLQISCHLDSVAFYELKK